MTMQPGPAPAGPSVAPFRSQLRSTTLKVGAPTALIIVAAVATALPIALGVAINPVLAALALAVTGIVGILLVLGYLWLDRWEPEPPRLLLLAWLWGGFAVLIGLLVGFLPLSEWAGAVIGAPFVEEFGKALFLVLMATGTRRKELNTLVDCLVYAGLVGAAFTFLEDTLYIATAGTVDAALNTAVARLLSPFGHSLYTSMTAIGLWIGLQRRSPAAKWGCMFGGYLVAVGLHALWNGGIGVNPLFVMGFSLLVFVGALLLALAARRRERRVLQSQLPGMVHDGLLSGIEAAWISSMRGRRGWRRAAKQYGRQAGKDVRTAVGALTELAFVRDRVDRGFGSAETAQRYNELTAVVAGTPRPPVPNGSPPIAAPVPPGPAGLTR